MFKETGLIQKRQSQAYVMLGVYKIRTEIEKRIVVHYTGSATGAGGLDQRLCQHYEILELESTEIAALRNEKRGVFYIYEVCANPNATYTIHLVATFPAPRTCHNLP
jgi:hypothetical protein